MGSAESEIGFPFSLLPLNCSFPLKDLSINGGGMALALLACLLLYVCYYLGWVAGKPRVVGTGKLRDKLLKNCPILSQCYWPTIWAFNRHLSTGVRFFLQRPPKIHYRRFVLRLSDGGEVALDWGQLHDDDDGRRTPDAVTAPTTTPVLLIIPGITGCNTDNYVQHLVEDAVLEGYRPVVFNQRGNGGLKLKTLRTYSGSDISDVVEVVRHIVRAYPAAPIVGVGISLGGMILIQYLHQLGSLCELSAVISISAGWDPFVSKKNLEGITINRLLYSRLIVNNIKGMMRSQLNELTPDQRKSLPIDINRLFQAQVVSEIDTHLTAPLFGYSSLDDYYTACRNNDKLHKVRRPFICITAADDPFVPEKSLPFEEFERNTQTVMVVTSHGGHFGFVEGLYPSSKTWMDRALSQILAVLKQQF